MFDKKLFMQFIDYEFNIEGATSRLIDNCIEFVKEHHQDDFVNKLYELLDNTIGIEKDEIEKFYKGGSKLCG